MTRSTTVAVLSLRPRQAEHDDPGLGAAGWFGVGAAWSFGIGASVLFPIVIVAIVFGRIFRASAARKELLRTGQQANATITEIRQTGTTLNQQPQCELMLLVSPARGDAYPAKVLQYVSLVELPRLMPGADVTVRVDAKDPSRVAIEAFGRAPTMTTADASARATEGQRILEAVNAIGVPAPAIVLSFTDSGVTVNGEGQLAILKLKVLPAGEAPFDATLTGAFARTGLHKYQAGHEVRVKYDPNDRTRVHFDLSAQG